MGPEHVPLLLSLKPAAATTRRLAALLRFLYS
jgi:hypothetical protein